MLIGASAPALAVEIPVSAVHANVATVDTDPSYVKNTPSSTRFSEKSFADESGSKGHYEYTATGLKVWTEDASAASKVSAYDWSLYPADGGTAVALSKVAESELALNYTNLGTAEKGDDAVPALLLVLDNNGDGAWKGNIVLEPAAYPDGEWWTTKDFGFTGGESGRFSGSLDQILEAYPDTQVIGIGFTLGSAAFGNGVITSIVANNTTYTFDVDAVVAPSYVKNTPSSTRFSEKSFADESGSKGHYEYTATGLKVWTEDASAASKVSAYDWSLYPADGGTAVALSKVAESELALNYTNLGTAEKGDDAVPALLLVLDNNGDGAWKGNIVLEPAAYPDGEWWTTKDFGFTGGESGRFSGSLDQILEAYPDTQVIGIGFTLGSAAFGNGVITSIVANNTTYTFGLDPFADIDGNPFEEQIVWMQQMGISTGTQNADGTSSFQPATTLSRQAMAAFMYRAAGSPEFTAPTTSHFTDVNTSDVFYREIAWLAAEGISTGYSDGSFRPNQPVSRQALAAYLHRIMGEPVPSGPSGFTDVDPASEFAEAISWASEVGITTGFEDNSFQPSASITRQAVAAFMYRAYNLG